MGRVALLHWARITWGDIKEDRGPIDAALRIAPDVVSR